MPKDTLLLPIGLVTLIQHYRGSLGNSRQLLFKLGKAHNTLLNATVGGDRQDDFFIALIRVVLATKTVGMKRCLDRAKKWSDFSLPAEF